MRRLVLPLAALLCMPLAGRAADESAVALQCLPPGERGEAPAFEPVPARPLTHQEERDLQRLFRSVDGGWRGPGVEQICMHSGGAKERQYEVTLKAQGSRDELRLHADYLLRELRTRQRFSKQLFLTPDGLRVDQRSRAGEVELVQADAATLVYRQRYRTVFRRAEEQPQGSATLVQQGVGGASNVVTLIPAAEASAAAGDPFAADPAAAAATAATAATADATAETKPPPKRTSVAREELFTLRLIDARNLEITQQFFTQGAYTGSMTWRLQRD